MILRRFEEADLENLVELDSDPEVMRFLNGGYPTPRDVVEREILPRFLQSDQSQNGYGYWAALATTTGEFLGWFGLNRRDGRDPRDVELGYRLRQAAWGQGYATEGARALIRRAFTELGARRVFATTYEHHLASRRVMEKAGMKVARTFRYSIQDLATVDTFQISSQELWEGDDVEYAIDKVEWARRNSEE